MRPLRLLVLAALALITMASAATADTWTAVRLRGAVLQLVAGVWQPVHRNDVVPDETLIRTLNNGYVDFARGAETVSLGPTTQIQIFDKGGAKPFTTVQQSFGTVTVDAEVKNVQHFAVETPYLAAVVKGTKFIVTVAIAMRDESGPAIIASIDHRRYANAIRVVIEYRGQQTLQHLVDAQGAWLVHDLAAFHGKAGDGLAAGMQVAFAHRQGEQSSRRPSEQRRK